MAYTYSTAALVAAHTAFRDLVDLQGAGSIRIYAPASVLLAEIPLSVPCGTVSGITGQLSLLAAGAEESAPAGGLAIEASICDALGVAHLTMPCAEGVAPVSGSLVLNTLVITAGTPVVVSSAVIG